MCNTPLFQIHNITKYKLTSPTGVLETLNQQKQRIKPDSLTKAIKGVSTI